MAQGISEEFKRALPPSVRRNVTVELEQRVKDLVADPDMAEQYRENLLSYAHVMKDGRFKIGDYLNAVKYVSHKLMGRSNQDAYRLTFPKRYQDMVARGMDDKAISAYVTAYNKTKLVNLILEQSLVPSWVLNQDLYQKALNVQAELMVTARSEKVRSDAANSLLTHLKRPETQQVELNLGVKEDSAIAALRESTMKLVAMQKQMMQAGMANIKEVAESNLIVDGEVVDE